MNTSDQYARFALVREMMETPAILRNFKLDGVEDVLKAITDKDRLFLTGEGSSRIFPAKNAIYSALRSAYHQSREAEIRRARGAGDDAEDEPIAVGFY